MKRSKKTFVSRPKENVPGDSQERARRDSRDMPGSQATGLRTIENTTVRRVTNYELSRIEGNSARLHWSREGEVGADLWVHCEVATKRIWWCTPRGLPGRPVRILHPQVLLVLQTLRTNLDREFRVQMDLPYT